MHADALQTTLALVARSASGSEQAFQDLFDRCIDGVRRAALFRLGAIGDQHRADVDDVIQEVFADVFTRIRNGGFDAARSDGGFRSYLAEVVKGKVVDLMRRGHTLRRGAGHVRALDALDTVAREAAGPRIESPTQRLQSEEAVNAIHTAMLTLKDDYRRVLDLHDLCEMSYEDIAAEMGYQKVEPVRLLVHRARAALARRLGRVEPD